MSNIKSASTASKAIAVGDKYKSPMGAEVTVVEILTTGDVKIRYIDGYTTSFSADTFLKFFSPISNDLSGQVSATSAAFDPSTPHTITIPISGNYVVDGGAAVWRRAGEQLEFTSSVREMNENKLSCTCGTHKTFGIDCDISFHSEWCELRSQS